MNCNIPPDSRSSQFLHTFWRVNRNMMRFIHKTALENDLSIPQYSILMTIAPRKEMTQKQLGEVLQIPKSTLSTAVDGLVQTEWLHRQPVPDNRREMQLILSEKGNSLFDKISQQKGSIHRTIESIMDTLTEQQFEEFQTTLLHIADFLDSETISKENNPDD
ncbi:MarR family transcriptional regulator [Psychrobacillus sp. NEAU-3TGS]|nr:MarR family transcriptional regulator [Psychrobacillus sp. NEAU-3TGS]